MSFSLGREKLPYFTNYDLKEQTLVKFRGNGVKKGKAFKLKKFLNMTNRRVVIRLIMSYTISGFC